MNVKYVAKKLQVSQEFMDKASAKLTKLDRFFGHEADAVLNVSTLRELVTIELTVKNDGILFRAEHTAPDKYDALDYVTDRIIRQIRKNKTKLEKHLHDVDFEDAIGNEPADASTEREQLQYNVVRRKEFYLRPMSADEAILQMNLLGHTFFMFKDADTGETNVVYKRNDGDYAVLEPAK